MTRVDRAGACSSWSSLTVRGGMLFSQSTASDLRAPAPLWLCSRNVVFVLVLRCLLILQFFRSWRAFRLVFTCKMETILSWSSQSETPESLLLMLVTDEVLQIHRIEYKDKIKCFPSSVKKIMLIFLCVCNQYWKNGKNVKLPYSVIMITLKNCHFASS